MTYQWQPKRSFAGFGQAQWATKLQAGQLKPVRSNFAPACAEGPGVCAFDPNDLNTIYLTRATPNWGAPPGYRVGPQPSSWSWASGGSAPWPGDGLAPSLAASLPTPATSTPLPVAPVASTPAYTTTNTSIPTGSISTSDPSAIIDTSSSASDSSSMMLVGGGVFAVLALVFLFVVLKKKKPLEYYPYPQ